MSNQISLTIPNDDPIALRAFGNALEEMAVAHGAEVRKPVIISHKHAVGDVSVETVMQGITEPLRSYQQTALDADSAPFTDDDTQLATDDTLDADGLPWDARIHSSNQERNADNTWRVRRRPKDLTPEQWAEQVAQVREELFALMAIPVVTSDYSADAPAAHEVMTADLGHDPAVAGGDYTVEVPVTDTESPAAVFGAPESMEVPSITVDVPPAPPIADPVPPAPAPLPPVVAADPVPPAPAPLPTEEATSIPTTLAELMTALTKYAPKDASDKEVYAAHVTRVNDVVKRHGLVALAQLQKRADLIPQVYADLVKEFGQ